MSVYLLLLLCVQRVFEVSKEEGIQLSKFLYVVGQLKFRGTSVLFRLPHSPVVKVTKTKSQVREISPVPGVAPESTEPNEKLQKVGKVDKKVKFASRLEQIGEGEVRGGEEEMEVGGGREGIGVKRGCVTRGRREEIDGENGDMIVDPEMTLPCNLPVVKLQDEQGRERDDRDTFYRLEGDEFSIATHFVKANQ